MDSRHGINQSVREDDREIEFDYDDDVSTEILSRFQYKNNKYYCLRNLTIYEEFLSIMVRFGMPESRRSVPYQVIHHHTHFQLIYRTQYYTSYTLTALEMRVIICAVKYHLSRSGSGIRDF